MSPKLRFLIITTQNLPEAYFLARHLIDRDQVVGVVNFRGRSFSHSLRILQRLRRRRGSRFVIDLLLGKLLQRFYNRPDVVPFPELDQQRIEEIQMLCDYFETDDMHNVATMDHIREFGVDYILIAGAPVIRQKLYSLANITTLNRHLGLSPEYRGSDCPVWAMANNDFEMTGYTIHELSDVVDGGEVLSRCTVSIPDEMDLSQSLSYISRKGSEGFIEVIDDIIDNKSESSVIQATGGAHFPPASLSAFRAAKRNLQYRSRK